MMLIQKNLDDWNTPYAEMNIFTTDSAWEVDANT
jgi:hypothetical protein